MRNTRSIDPKAAVKLLAAAAVSLLGAAAPVQASPFMSLGDVAPAPLGFLDFCLRHVDQCLIAQPAPAAKAPVAKPAQAEPVAALSADGGDTRATAEATPVAALFSRHADSLPGYEVRVAAAAVQGRGLDTWRARFALPVSVAAVAFDPPRPAGARPAPFWAARGEASFAVRLAQASAKPAEASISLEQALQTVRPPETVDADATMIRSTPQFLGLLQQVNRNINGAIIKREDFASRGVADHWDLPLADGGKPYGDCEDFVLEKRRALVAQGVSPRALSMAIARTRRGELHAVLVVTTDRGELVLDNLSPWVTPWAELNYTWIQRQVAGDAFKWAVING